MGETMNMIKRITSLHAFCTHLMIVAAACGVALIPAGPAAAQRTLTLGDALDIAIANSPTIKHYQLSLERSRESLNAQRAGLKSQFSLNLTPISYSRDRRFESLISQWYRNESTTSMAGFIVEQPLRWTDGTLTLRNQFMWQDVYTGYTDSRSRTYSNNLSISFDQPIFTYNRKKLDLRRLELEYENANLSYAIQRLRLEKLVTEAFFDVYRNKMQLEIDIEAFENQQNSYGIMKNKVDAGLEKREEFYQSEVDLATKRANMQNSQVTLENSYDHFKELIGISIFDEIAINEDISYQPVPTDLQMALDHGLEYRMELQQRRIDIENQRMELTRASAQNEFMGNINLTYGSFGTDERFGDIYDAPDRDEQVTVSLEIPLWDWGRKKASIRAVEAGIAAGELSLDEERSGIIIDIRRAYRNLQNQAIQIDIARKSVRNAQLTYDISLERYKNGDLTSMDLNLQQIQLSEKKMQEVSALINYRLALLELKIQSLWDFERNESVVPRVKTER
ncbi:MAG TPA: TolC family protein [Patescibacteria group bacterium]|nr:TolC family protein [Patescibacteria group bacterium]